MCQRLKEGRKLSCGLGGETRGEFQRTEIGVLFIYQDKPWRTDRWFAVEGVLGARVVWRKGRSSFLKCFLGETSFLCLTKNDYSWPVMVFLCARKHEMA